VTELKDEVAAAIVRAQIDLERALAGLERLPALDPGKVVFAAHALNNFLTVVAGTTDLLLTTLEDHPDRRVHVWLAGIHRATTMMSHLSTGLMTTASASGTPALTLEQVDLTVLLRRAVAFYQHRADPKQIRIRFVSPVEPASAWADRVAVAVVVDNLLSNAIKYSPRGAQITVSVRRERATTVCDVQDEGPGLSVEDQAKLFQRGVRLASVPTGGETSMGYGLAIAYELLREQDGVIWCTSERGRGATFSFSLPEYRGQIAVAGAPDAAT
jgi:signal transduction histidine kinase